MEAENTAASTEALVQERLRNARLQDHIRMGIGVHSGPALVGTIGAPHRRESTVVGDTVNLASRRASSALRRHARSRWSAELARRG